MPSDNNANENPKENAPKRAKTFSQQFAMAMELPFVLVATVVVGGTFGFLLDRWLHTKPILMLIFGVLGFVAGLRDMFRRMASWEDGKSQN